MSPWLTMGMDIRDKNVDCSTLRKMFQEWKQTAPYLLGDYYPLTDYSPASDVWMALQFHLPEKNEGVIRAYRRETSLYETIRVKLHDLDPAAVYSLMNLDVPGSTEISGRELMEKGLSITIENQPGTAVIVYKKVAK
jgi:hypothetical protein